MKLPKRFFDLKNVFQYEIDMEFIFQYETPQNRVPIGKINVRIFFLLLTMHLLHRKCAWLLFNSNMYIDDQVDTHLLACSLQINMHNWSIRVCMRVDRIEMNCSTIYSGIMAFF